MCVVLTGNRGGGWGGGPQQAISSSVPSVACRGTVTVWLMDSEWFATGSQELWEKKPGEQRESKISDYVLAFIPSPRPPAAIRGILLATLASGP